MKLGCTAALPSATFLLLSSRLCLPAAANMWCREEESSEVHGHITSLAVARTHRKLGLATKLMSAAREPALWLCHSAGPPLPAAVPRVQSPCPALPAQQRCVLPA